MLFRLPHVFRPSLLHCSCLYSSSELPALLRFSAVTALNTTKGLLFSHQEALNLLVRLVRVELTTLCLGGRCSIQLSYNRRSNVPIYYNAIVQYFARRNYSPQRFPQATWLRIAARQEIPVRHLLAFLCFLRLRRCSSMEITLSFFATAFWAAFRARWAAFSLSRSS